MPASKFSVERLGVIMGPELGNAQEAEGVLNPAVARGKDGELYLFPRLIGAGNYSRIGIARVRFNAHGNPSTVERLGLALEPQADYELHPGGGGCEDPRISYLKDRALYVMTYTAFSSHGPRIALAVSDDLLSWRRLGLATFLPLDGIDVEGVVNKDAAVFPVPVQDVDGRMALAMLHRPLFPGTRPEETRREATSHTLDLARESIWISYCRNLELCHFTSHRRLASPAASWERLKIGAGCPPVMTRHGWLEVYHGVSASAPDDGALVYAAGVMVLEAHSPHRIIYRSVTPILTPQLPQERVGTVADVVFPTGIDRRDDIGDPDRLDVYYGMADNRIGVARLLVPPVLAGGDSADPHDDLDAAPASK